MIRPYAAAQGLIGSDLSKCSVGWVGDHDGGFAGIATQMNDVYTSAQMGYGAPGVEVGGYVNAPSKDSLIRYAEFGALTPLMENGGTNGGLTQHLPWFWDAQTVTIYQYFATGVSASELGSYNFSYRRRRGTPDGHVDRARLRQDARPTPAGRSDLSVGHHHRRDPQIGHVPGGRQLDRLLERGHDLRGRHHHDVQRATRRGTPCSSGRARSSRSTSRPRSRGMATPPRRASRRCRSIRAVIARSRFTVRSARGRRTATPCSMSTPPRARSR